MIKNLLSVTSHALYPLPSVTNCHTFSDPLQPPRAWRTLWTAPLRICCKSQLVNTKSTKPLINWNKIKTLSNIVKSNNFYFSKLGKGAIKPYLPVPLQKNTETVHQILVTFQALLPWRVVEASAAIVQPPVTVCGYSSFAIRPAPVKQDRYP